MSGAEFAIAVVALVLAAEWKAYLVRRKNRLDAARRREVDLSRQGIAS